MVNNTPKTKPIVEMQPILKPCFKIKRGHWKTCRAKNAPYLSRTSPYPPFHWVPPPRIKIHLVQTLSHQFWGVWNPPKMGPLDPKSGLSTSLPLTLLQKTNKQTFLTWWTFWQIWGVSDPVLRAWTQPCYCQLDVVQTVNTLFYPRFRCDITQLVLAICT